MTRQTKREEFPRFFRNLHTSTALALGAFALLALTTPSYAGTVMGKIINSSTGEPMTKARVTVEGTNIETFTDDFGEYRLELPAGTAKISAGYTGFSTKEVSVSVTSDGFISQNISLGMSGQTATKGADEIVMLDSFSVTEARETNAFNIAANEQRYATNIKNVVSADAFGDVTEGNVGEFIKYLPGITVDYVAADVRTINVRGFASSFTNVSFNGMRMTSSVSGSANRAFELEQVSINNMSRAEVVKVPTPETPADSLGGNVNLVPKNAFERKGVNVNYRAYVSLNSEDLHLMRSAGPGDKETVKILPGADIDITIPITKDFGIVITALTSNQFNEQHRTNPTWNHKQAGATETNPYFQSLQIQDGPKNTWRDSFSIRGDYRFRPGHTLSFGFQTNYYQSLFANRNINFGVGTNAAADGTGTALSWGPTFAQSATGRGTVTQGSSYRSKNGNTQAFDAMYRAKNNGWEWDFGAHSAVSRSWYRDLDRGYFASVNTAIPATKASATAGIAGVATLRFDGNEYPRPRTIEARNAAGGLIDWTKLNNYLITSVRTQPLDGTATMRGVLADVKTDLDFSFPMSFKTGIAYRAESRDRRAFQEDFTFVGADGKANTWDDNASPYLQKTYINQEMYFGMPAIQWASPYKLVEIYKNMPSYFVPVSSSTQDAGVAAEIYRIQNSQYIKETTTSGYVQLESKLLQNKLSIVTGLRYEKTQDNGEGYLYDPDAIYQRNADGSFVMNGTSRVRKTDAGPVSTGKVTLQEVALMYKERGYKLKNSYSDVYPSLHLNYNVTDDLIARFAYAQSYGRPDFADIIPSATIDDNEAADMDSSLPPGTITMANVGLKPWKADNIDLSFEYYFKRGGILSIGAFRKELANFWGNINTTADAALISKLGIDPKYAGWTIVTKDNVGDARISGIEFNFQQKLDFIPGWGKYFNVTTNGTWLKLEGPNGADFKRFIPRSANIGLTFSKKPFVVMVKLNHRGRQRWDAQTGTAYQTNATTPQSGGVFYEYDNQRNTIDVNFEYQLKDNIAFFANARNIGNVPQDRTRYNSLTPDYAKYGNTEEYGVQWAIGVKGKF